METAIIVVWWIALLGAIPLTVLAVLDITHVVHHAREINRLATRTLPAAGGIAANTAVIADLQGVVPVVQRLLAAADLIDRTAAAIEGRTAAVGRALQRKGGS